MMIKWSNRSEKFPKDRWYSKNEYLEARKQLVLAQLSEFTQNELVNIISKCDSSEISIDNIKDYAKDELIEFIQEFHVLAAVDMLGKYLIEEIEKKNNLDKRICLLNLRRDEKRECELYITTLGLRPNKLLKYLTKSLLIDNEQVKEKLTSLPCVFNVIFKSGIEQDRFMYGLKCTSTDIGYLLAHVENDEF